MFVKIAFMFSLSLFLIYDRLHIKTSCFTAHGVLFLFRIDYLIYKLCNDLQHFRFPYMVWELASCVKMADTPSGALSARMPWKFTFTCN